MAEHLSVPSMLATDDPSQELGCDESGCGHQFNEHYVMPDGKRAGCSAFECPCRGFLMLLTRKWPGGEAKLTHPNKTVTIRGHTWGML